MTKIAVIDIETTGLDPVYNLICEVGIVELDLSTGERKVIFDKIVKEDGFGEEHRGEWIFQYSNLIFEDVLDAPKLEIYRDELQAIFNKYGISAFNKSFDLGFLKNRGFVFPYELPCIMITATNVCRIPFRNPLDIERYEGQEYKWPKVQEAWNFLFPNSDYIEGHRATDDAMHEAKILYELYLLGYYYL